MDIIIRQNQNISVEQEIGYYLPKLYPSLMVLTMGQKVWRTGRRQGDRQETRVKKLDEKKSQLVSSLLSSPCHHPFLPNYFYVHFGLLR